MPQVQGGRAGQAPPMTKCAIDRRRDRMYQVNRRVRPIPVIPAGSSSSLYGTHRAAKSGARRGFLAGFGRVLAGSLGGVGELR